MHTNELTSLVQARPVQWSQPAFSVRTQKRLFRLALLASDGLMVAAAFAIGFWLRFDLQIALAPEVEPPSDFYVALGAVLLPIWLGLFAFYGLYDWRGLLGGAREYSLGFNACTTGMMLVVTATFFKPEFVIARGWMVFSWLFSILLVCGARFGLRRVAYRLRRRGYFVVPAVVVGSNGEAAALLKELGRWEDSGLRIVGAIQSRRHAENGLDPLGLPVLGTLDEVEQLTLRHGVQEIIVAGNCLQTEELLDLFERVHGLKQVEIRFSTGLFEVLTTGIQVNRMGSVPLVSLNKLRLEPKEALMKSALDYVLTVVGLVVLTPLLALISLLVKLDSPGPILHRRRVMGVGGREFEAFKFRTMYLNGDEILSKHRELQAQLEADEKLKKDPRVTWLGSFLRRYSLDELPQLFNVLAGKMSLIGPRMISPQEARKYGRHKTNLLTVKPGITGLWQVSGRSDLSYEERVGLDMQYIRNYSIWLDLHILFIRTAGAVIRGKGAY